VLVLNTTLRSLQVVLGGAITTNQLDCTAQFRDWRHADKDVAFGSNVTATNNTTAVTLVAAPGSGVLREVFTLTVYNKDTAAATVTVRYNENGTTYIIAKFTLDAGDSMNYTADFGWTVHASDGSRKTAS
jgi:hypothetical protein